MLKTFDLGYTFLFCTLLLPPFLISFCSCSSSMIFNFSAIDETNFSNAVATWYGDPTGAGTDGGACGYGDDVSKPPFNSMVSAGNANLFKLGKGCGACYAVKCTENPACSGNPVTVTITDECPGGYCNSDPIHFDLSGTAFGDMANSGQADLLRQAGILNIQFRRASCNYRDMMVEFHIDMGSNPSYFACLIEYEDGDGDLSSVELQVAGDSSATWLPMQQSWGATWIIDLSPVTKAPFSIRLTTLESNKTIIADNVIPADWAPGNSYQSHVNFN